jgi:hypothetical protein
MTIEWLARLALALWFIYSIASYAEGLRARGSVGLRWLNAMAELSMVVVLAWVGW